jgi:acetoin utilization deacetylase AcuC-like enzyme
MPETAIVFTPKYLNHKTGVGHPESPARLRVIMRELRKSGLFGTGTCFIVTPKQATMKDVELVHSSEHVRLVQRLCASGGGLLDLGDTVVSSESFDVALYAAGGAIQAVELVMAGKCRNAFALLRPPGHHAGQHYSLGFCVFNNAAIAAAHLVNAFDLDRVLILDIDAHHGNGTQEIFYNNEKVLYISLHQDPSEFPGTGFQDEVGEEEGLGFNVNIPFPFRINDQIYNRAFNQIVIPIITQYKPQFMVVSTGFDSHYLDPVANLSLSALNYAQTFRKILDLATKLCEGKLVALLEGGYNIRLLGKMAVSVIASMAKVPYSFKDKRPVTKPGTQKRAQRTIDEVKRIQSRFWDMTSRVRTQKY